MSIHQDIRGALQNAAIAVPGFPPSAQRAYDGLTFTPTPKTPWARLAFMPQPSRPFAIKGTDQLIGLFQVSLFYPPNLGTATVEAMADAVVAAFPTETPLLFGTARVQILSSGRGPGLPEADWYQVPVTVRWQCLTAS